MRKFRVLVFPGSTEIGLEVQRALKDCKDIELFSAAMNVSNHAPFVFRNHFIIPSIYNTHWIDALNALIKENEIHCIIPAYDDIVIALAKNKNAISTSIITSPLDTCELTRSKSTTYARFEKLLPVPALYSKIDDVPGYPVFVKPDKGQGSQGTHLVNDDNTLRSVVETEQQMIILEYLPGNEYTVDCFTDRDKGLLFVGARQRVRTRNGISMSSRPVYLPQIEQYAQTINDTIELHGAWFFQVKEDAAGKLHLLEIAPRVAGTMALHRVHGINFPLLSIYEHYRFDISILKIDSTADIQIDRALTNRYRHKLQYSTVYVDLDDTLIIRGKVNVELVSFLYQCINERRKLVLLTRHRGDLQDTLNNYRLEGLFDKLIQIDDASTKADYIVEKDAIFIDDSFSERQSVNSQLEIPTFDCSMLELLIDSRS